MFGLFKSKPPLSPWEKAWTENRMGWMASHFGMNSLLDAPTLVSDYAGIPDVSNKEEATELLTFIKQWMKFDFDAHLQVFSDTPTLESNANVSEESLRIEVHEKHFQDRDALIAIVARQLAQQAVVGTVIQNEGWAIDLYPAFCGLGIFAANATLRSTGKSDGLSWWTTQQQGYLPSRIFGYALALRHTVRGDANTEWSSVLRQDALVAFEEGVTYLEKTKDTVFNRDLLTKPREGISQEALLEELRTGSPSLRIAAMWAFNKRAVSGETIDNPKLVDLVMDCLRHKEPEVRAVAASTLPRYDLSATAAQEIGDALRDRNDKVRISAAEAMGAFVGVEDEIRVTELTDALKDDVRLVVFNAAKSLTAYGEAAEPASKMLLQRLRRSLNECRDDDSRTILWAINAISSNPTAKLEEFFGEQDGEYLAFSKELLEEVNQPA